MRRVLPLVALALVASSLTLTGSLAAASCDAATTSGGEWRGYGGDLHNTRNQAGEDTIGPAEATLLTPAWAVSTAALEATGSFQSTPTVADGCVYAATSSGDILALDAGTGELVWRASMNVGGLANGVFGVSVKDGKLFANVSNPGGPFAIALDASDGTELWRTEALDTQQGAWLNSSAVVWDDLMFVGFSVAEGNEKERGGYAIIDTDTGDVLVNRYTIPDEDADGQGGAGIWATAVVDQETGYLYTGTSNPYTRDFEHRYSNAIVKIDVDRSRSTFGAIVDAYKGNIDQYYPPLALLAASPACKAEEIPATIDYPQCGQIDIDFGASPNLFTNSKGQKLIGELQKSGVYHAVYADTMQLAWAAIVGGPCALCNSSTSAVDENAVYVASTPGGQVVALDKDTGAYKWATPIADGVHYEAVSAANGVVYAVDTKGVLNGFDAATGVPVLARPMSVDTLDACVPLGAGAAIALNTVFSPCDVGGTGGSWLVAYKAAA